MHNGPLHERVQVLKSGAVITQRVRFEGGVWPPRVAYVSPEFRLDCSRVPAQPVPERWGGKR